jgi:Phage portal protein, SPP1 Gp6-like
VPVTPLDIAQIGIRRRAFAPGMNDKYAAARTSLLGTGGPASVVEAVRSELGFIDAVKDTGIYTEFYRDDATVRLARYKKMSRFYEGTHYDNEYDDGEKKPVFNFCKVVVDKSIDFFASKGFTVGSSAGNEDLAKAVEMVWDYNDKELLTRKLAITAAILGDTYLYVTLETKGIDGVELPQASWRVRLYQIDPFFCFPVFDDINHREMRACMIQMPLKTDGKGGVIYKTIFITPDYYQEIVDGQLGAQIANPFKSVNVVHFPNYDDPLKVWGQSDLAQIVPLNEEYNIVANSVRKIIKYHAEPTTVIYGARASRLEKGAKKVWSGLPTDARVENLKFEGNLEATYKYLSILEDQIHKGAGIPDVLFQTDRAVSHTSAIAMKMLYQPILEKTERKAQSFSSAFRRTNKLIFTAFTLTQVDYASLATNPSDNLWDDIYPVFPDPLPYDEMGQIDADQKKFNLGVVSIATLIRKYNPAGDFARTSVELLADKMALLLYEREKAIALTGGSPNPVVVTLSSIGLDEAVSKLASEIASSVPAKITPPPTTVQPPT